MQKIRFILVDDHRVVRAGIRSMMVGQQMAEMIGEAYNADKLFTLLEKGLPDIVVMDIRMPGSLSGIEATRRVKKQYPKVKILILSGDTTQDYLIPAFQAGATGFLNKDCSRDTFLEALQKVYYGQNYFSDEDSSRIFQYFQQGGNEHDTYASVLTEREVEITRAFAEGNSYKEIADKLSISPRTVETHKKNIMQKLGLDNLADLVRYAIKHNIADL
ncbi:MAG: response regulator transcription factor [Bacteroidota bacterium]